MRELTVTEQESVNGGGWNWWDVAGRLHYRWSYINSILRSSGNRAGCLRRSLRHHGS